mgnify:FL=1
MSLIAVILTGVNTSKASSDCVWSNVHTWPLTTCGAGGAGGGSTEVSRQRLAGSRGGWLPPKAAGWRLRASCAGGAPAALLAWIGPVSCAVRSEALWCLGPFPPSRPYPNPTLS